MTIKVNDHTYNICTCEQDISDWNISKKTKNALLDAGITTLNQILQYTIRELYEYENIGKVSIREIEAYLASGLLTLKSTKYTDFVNKSKRDKEIIVNKTYISLKKQISQLNRLSKNIQRDFEILEKYRE